MFNSKLKTLTMKKKIYIAVLLAIFMPLFAMSQNNVQHQINYHTEHQDMWGGQPFNLMNVNYNVIDLILGDDENPTASNQTIGNTTLSLGIAFDAFEYVRSTFSMGGFSRGWVDVDFPIEVTLGFPADFTFNHGETFTITSSYEIQDGWALNTHFPEGGNVSLDLEYDFDVDMSVETSVAGTVLSNMTVIDVNAPTTPALTDPQPHDSVPIFFLNGGTQQYMYPAATEAGVSYIATSATLPVDIPIASNFGISGTINLPNVTTTSRTQGQCLYATGTDRWMNFSLDVMDYLRFVSGMETAEGTELAAEMNDIAGGTVQYTLSDDLGLTATIEYYLLNADLSMTGDFMQDFVFCPVINATITFPTVMHYQEQTPAGIIVQDGTSNTITFTVNNNLVIDYPCHDWDEMQITGISYSIVPNFTNISSNNIQMALAMNAMLVNMNIPTTLIDYGKPATRNVAMCIPSTCQPFESVNMPLSPLPLTTLSFNETWQLGGFAQNIVRDGTWLRPNPELSLAVSKQDVACFGDVAGSISSVVADGVPDYTWTYSNGETVTQEETTHEITVPAGYYYITVTDGSGCQATGEANVLNANPRLQATSSAINVACSGENSGTLMVNPTGGLAPYSYEWQPNGSTEQNVYGVGAGDYTVLITDAAGCTAQQSLTITEPANPLVITGADTQNILCFGNSTGSINLSVDGGTAPYSYEWSNGAHVQDLSNIVAGIYDVTVTDALGCVVTASYTITQPDQLTVDVVTTDIKCFGLHSGSVDLTALGGMVPYSYEWSTGETTHDLQNLDAGYYLATVTDGNGCTEYAMAQVVQPVLPLQVSATSTNIRCFGDADGTIDLTVQGGTQPYEYIWSNDEISSSLRNLVPGTYYVTINDANLCSVYDTIQITQPVAPMSGYISGTDVSCNGGSDGSVIATFDGGTQPYQYEWSNGVWQQNLYNVVAGEYSVTATDANLCHHEMTYTITEPDPFYVQMMDDITICYGMTVQIGIGILSGSVPPYTIHWSEGDGGMTNIVTPTATTTYTATISDAANCTSTEQHVTVTVLDPLKMTVNLLSDTIACPGTEVAFDVVISGGNANPNQVYVNDSLITLPYRAELNLNDTVFNFVTYDECRFDSVVVPIAVHAYPLPDLHVETNKSEGCSPLTVYFSENTYASGQTYLWNFDDGEFENLSMDKTPVHTFGNNGTHHVNLQVTSVNGCINDTTIDIVSFESPIAEFRVDRNNISTESPKVEFTNYSYGGFWNSWTFGDGGTSSEANPTHIYTMPGNFHVVLTTTSLYGCTDTTGVDIYVTNEHTLYVPTAFTPNGDELNDEFKAFGTALDEEHFEMFIYDRWGKIAFHTTDINEGWDGTYKKNKEFPEGVYSYRVYCMDIYGNEYEKTGTFVLIR